MSNHHPGTVAVPDIRLGSRFAGVERSAGLAGVIGLLLCVIGFFINRAEFFHSYLFAFFYWGGFTMGGLGILLMNNVVGGKWGVTTRRLLEAKMRTLPVLFLLFLPLLLGIPYLYPWANDVIHHNKIVQHKAPYLNLPFFLVRVVIYFAIWLFWGFRVRKIQTSRMKRATPV